MNGLNVIVLHKISSTSPQEWSDVGLDFFETLLDMMSNDDKVSTSIGECQQRRVGKIALSFDDGNLSDYETVFPLLQKYNAKATFFVVSDFVGKKGYVSWSQLREMSGAGMEIASHSKSHHYLTQLSKNELIIELQASKSAIEEKIGVRVDSFAYPYGDCSKKTHDQAFDVGYTNVCNSRPGLVKESTKIIPRNSVNSYNNSTDIRLIVQPVYMQLLKKRMNYAIRTGLKNTIGISRYIKLRNFIFS